METPISTSSTLTGASTPECVSAPQASSDSITQSDDLPTSEPEEEADTEKEKVANREPFMMDGELSDDRYPDDIVGWDGPDDPECPRNWSTTKKVLFVITTSSAIAVVSYGSSVFGPAAKISALEFGVAQIVMQLGVALWILGFFTGPIFFGPMSELYGHRNPFCVSLAGLAIFQIPIALGKNVETILIFRFFSGVFGSGVFAVVSGMYVELFEPISRGVALGLSSICINLGATIAPIAGAYLTAEDAWRWTAWSTMVLAGCVGVITFVLVKESSSREILKRKARRLRSETGNQALRSKWEEGRVEFGDFIARYLTKPIRMFVTEPILVIFTVYLTLVYGTLYLSFQAFPLAFQAHGWSVPTSMLPFIAVLMGIITAWLVQSVFTLTYFKKQMVATNGVTAPEDRLPPMIAGALLLPPSLFWFGWSGGVNPASQVVASYCIGLGLMLIFVPGITYIVDVYQFNSNSAMSIHVVVRSLVACSFPMFANIMYTKLGVAWASSLLAFLCVALAPAPIVFYLYGKQIRSWSRFAFDN